MTIEFTPAQHEAIGLRVEVAGWIRDLLLAALYDMPSMKKIMSMTFARV